MYNVIITRFGKTTVIECADLTDANFTILHEHAEARDIGMVQGRHYDVELVEVA